MENIRKLTIKQAAVAIKEFAKKVNEAKLDDETKRQSMAFFLVSSPGIGKTSLAKQIAGVLSAETKEQWGVHIIHPSHRDPGDVLGIPFPNENKTKTVRLHPEDIFPESLKKVKFGVYIIDELTSCPPEIQASLYSLLLEGRVDGVEIPAGWVRIATGNKVDDSAVVFNMSSALINRMTIFEIIPNVDDFEEYVSNKYKGSKEAALVVSYLKKNHDKFYGDLKDYDGSQFPSPRKWEKVIVNLTVMGLNNPVIEDLIAGDVGNSTAVHFTGFLKIANKIPEIDELLDNPKRYESIFDDGDVLAALMTMVPAYLINNDVKEFKKFIKKGGLVDFLRPEVITMILKTIKNKKPEMLLFSKEITSDLERIKNKYPEIFVK